MRWTVFQSANCMVHPGVTQPVGQICPGRYSPRAVLGRPDQSTPAGNPTGAADRHRDGTGAFSAGCPVRAGCVLPLPRRRSFGGVPVARTTRCTMCEPTHRSPGGGGCMNTVTFTMAGPPTESASGRDGASARGSIRTQRRFLAGGGRLSPGPGLRPAKTLSGAISTGATTLRRGRCLGRAGLRRVTSSSRKMWTRLSGTCVKRTRLRRISSGPRMARGAPPATTTALGRCLRSNGPHPAGPRVRTPRCSVDGHQPAGDLPLRSPDHPGGEHPCPAPCPPPSIS